MDLKNRLPLVIGFVLLSGCWLAACASIPPTPILPTPIPPTLSQTPLPQPSPTPQPRPTAAATQTLAAPLPPLPTAQANPAANPQIAALLTQVEEQQVNTYLQGLTGQAALTIGSAPAQIESRMDAQNLEEVTQALYEFLQAQGLNTSYQEWYDDLDETGGRNVIGELPGVSHPEEIVILSAHIDSYCEESRCPGADDNASGAVGVLLAAQTLPQLRFERTLRFVFFTGEEIDLLGSYYYAEELRANGEDVVAVINLDMLGWDGDGNGAALLYTHACGRQNCPADQAIAEAFVQAVKDYQIENFYPQITQGEYDATDAYSFWEAGFPAIFAIEDDQDEENPYYHTNQDTPATLDLAYLTRYIRAAVATAAELAMPVEP